MSTIHNQLRKNPPQSPVSGMRERWNSLIELVRKNMPLYNQRDPDYSNRQIVEQLWNHIGKKLNRSAQDYSKKWQSLRSGYRKRKKTLPSGSAAKKMKPWPYFDTLSFLEPYFNERETVTNFSDVLGTPTASGRAYRSQPSSSTQEKFSLKLVEHDDSYFSEESENTKMLSENPSETSEAEKSSNLEGQGSDQEPENTDELSETQNTSLSLSHRDETPKKKLKTTSVDDEFKNYLRSAATRNTPKNSMELFLLSLVEDSSALSKRSQNKFKIGTLKLIQQLQTEDIDTPT